MADNRGFKNKKMAREAGKKGGQSTGMRRKTSQPEISDTEMISGS
jgi:general stress protein YciG